MIKPINELLPNDLEKYLIWKPIDDFEDPKMEVESFIDSTLDAEELYIIAADFIFSDGSRWNGYVRFSWGKTIEFRIAINQNEFLFIPMTKDEKIKFTRKINKKENDIFPIQYILRPKLQLTGNLY